MFSSCYFLLVNLRGEINLLVCICARNTIDKWSVGSVDGLWIHTHTQEASSISLIIGLFQRYVLPRYNQSVKQERTEPPLAPFTINDYDVKIINF